MIDLGTGDGRILIAAARDRGARGLGVDIDPVRIRQAQANASCRADRVDFVVADLSETPLGRADVVMKYLLPEVNLQLRPRLRAELRPGARVVSHAFDMGDWQPDDTRRMGGDTVYRWTIPERVDAAGLGE